MRSSVKGGFFFVCNGSCVWVQQDMTNILKNINVRRKRGNKCRNQVLEKVRGKGIQDKSADAGHRRKQGHFIYGDGGGDQRYGGTGAVMKG